MKKILTAFSAAIFFSQPLYSSDWPVIKKYDQEHTYRIALPIGGIDTWTVSLGGRGNLQDWEIMNRPAKGGSSGARSTNHGLPRFDEVSFEAAYPFGQVNLITPQIPVSVKIKAFNPLIPGDIDNISI